MKNGEHEMTRIIIDHEFNTTGEVFEMRSGYDFGRWFAAIDVEWKNDGVQVFIGYGATKEEAEAAAQDKFNEKGYKDAPLSA